MSYKSYKTKAVIQDFTLSKGGGKISIRSVNDYLVKHDNKNYNVFYLSEDNSKDNSNDNTNDNTNNSTNDHSNNNSNDNDKEDFCLLEDSIQYVVDDQNLISLIGEIIFHHLSAEFIIEIDSSKINKCCTMETDNSEENLSKIISITLQGDKK